MRDLADLFPGFGSEWINTSAGRIFARTGGKGPPRSWPVSANCTWPSCSIASIIVLAIARFV